MSVTLGPHLSHIGIPATCSIAAKQHDPLVASTKDPVRSTPAEALPIEQAARERDHARHRAVLRLRDELFDRGDDPEAPPAARLGVDGHLAGVHGRGAGEPALPAAAAGRSRSGARRDARLGRVPRRLPDRDRIQHMGVCPRAYGGGSSRLPDLPRPRRSRSSSAGCCSARAPWRRRSSVARSRSVG